MSCDFAVTWWRYSNPIKWWAMLWNIIIVRHESGLDRSVSACKKKVACLIIFFFFHFRLTTFLPQIGVKFAVHWGLKVMFNSVGRVTSLPLGSSLMGLPHFSLWTGVFCGISSADDETVIPLLLGPQSLISQGRWGWGLGRRGYWLHFTTNCTPLISVIFLLKYSQHLDTQFAPHATYV